MLRKIPVAIARLVERALGYRHRDPKTPCDTGWLVFVNDKMGAKLLPVGFLEYSVEYCDGLEGEMYYAFNNWNREGLNSKYRIEQIGNPGRKLNCDAVFLRFKPLNENPWVDESILTIRYLAFLEDE